MSDIQDAPSKIIINGQEFDETEANDLIEYGRKVKDYESRTNTSVDKVYPEYTRSQQTLKQTTEELADARKQLAEFNSARKEGTETPADVTQAREAAKKLGITLNDDLEQRGYVKKADLDSYFQEQEQKRQAVQGVLASADKLADEINGSDGRPKFNKKAVLAYASQYQMSDLKAAYEDMHADDIKAWTDAQINAQKAKSLKTLGKGGEKVPTTPKVTRDNFAQILAESLASGNE